VCLEREPPESQPVGAEQPRRVVLDLDQQARQALSAIPSHPVMIPLTHVTLGKSENRVRLSASVVPNALGQLAGLEKLIELGALSVKENHDIEGSMLVRALRNVDGDGPVPIRDALHDRVNPAESMQSLGSAVGDRREVADSVRCTAIGRRSRSRPECLPMKRWFVARLPKQVGRRRARAGGRDWSRRRLQVLRFIRRAAIGRDGRLWRPRRRGTGAINRSHVGKLFTGFTQVETSLRLFTLQRRQGAVQRSE